MALCGRRPAAGSAQRMPDAPAGTTAAALAAELAEARETARERTEIGAHAQDGLRVARKELRRVREDKQRMEEELRRLRAEVLVLHEERAQEMDRHVSTLSGRRQQRSRRSGRGSASRVKQPAVATGGYPGRRDASRSPAERDAHAGRALTSQRNRAPPAQAPRPSPIGPRRERARAEPPVLGRPSPASRSPQELLKLFKRVAWSVGRARCRQRYRRPPSSGWERDGSSAKSSAKTKAPHPGLCAALTNPRHEESLVCVGVWRGAGRGPPLLGLA